jgi:hypothetical protein
MDTPNNWQLWQPVDEDLHRLLQPGFASRLQPQHPLMKLRRNLKMNTIYGMVITAAYILIICTTPVWPVQLAMAITAIFNIVLLIPAVKMYRNIQTTISPADSVLFVLKKHHHDINAWCRMQNRLAGYIYPVAATGGYIYGGVWGSGKSFEQLFAEPLFLWVLPVTLIVLVPLGLLLAKWLTKKAFGVYLDTLLANITALEL